MSSTAVDTTAATQAQTAVHHHHHGRHKQVVDSVAKSLGMSDDDLKSELKSGKSLADVAQEKGVSRDDLLKSIEQGLTEGSDGSQSVDQSRLDRIAQRIADRKPDQDGTGDRRPPAQSPYNLDVLA